MGASDSAPWRPAGFQRVNEKATSSRHRDGPDLDLAKANCMDISEIKTLTQLMVDNDLAEIIIRDGERRILLRRKGSAVEHVVQAVHQPAPPQPMAAPAQPAPAPAAAAPAAASSLPGITSPMVGTYYASSNPESPPFVRVGDRVSPDTVICIIEAMKVFNEIKAEVSGIIDSIEVQNGAPVEFGQVLMKVRPG